MEHTKGNWIHDFESENVVVEYPDGKGNHITTIAELRGKWKEETFAWQENFFLGSQIAGRAYSEFGIYTMQKAIKKADHERDLFIPCGSRTHKEIRKTG